MKMKSKKQTEKELFGSINKATTAKELDGIIEKVKKSAHHLYADFKGKKLDLIDIESAYLIKKLQDASDVKRNEFISI